MTLKQVFYVPQFNKSIISIPQIAWQGFSVCFNDKQSEILFPDNSVLRMPILKDGLYYLPATHICPDSAYTTQVAETQIVETQHVPPQALKQSPLPARASKNHSIHINVIHHHFGHASEGVLWQTFNALGYKVVGTLQSFDACRFSKAKTKEICKFTDTRSTVVGERLF